MMRSKMVVSMFDIRNYCIKNDFYTKGTNEEYEALLSRVGYESEVTLSDLRSIAMDIIEKSDIDKYWNYGVDGLLEKIIFEFLNDVVTHTIEL